MNTATQAADDPRSDAEVDIGNPEALARWSRALGVEDEALQRAVQAVGPRVDRIKDWLGAGGMAGEQAGG